MESSELDLDKYSDLKIPSFKNEREFNQEIDEILLITKDTSGDWKKRENAIKKIGAQLLDLRSSVMKEACRIAVLSAEVYKMNIEFAIDKLISPTVLFKLVGCANKVISEAASNTIEEMIKHVDSVKVIERIYEHMKNKGNTVRLRASQNFLYVLNNYSEKILSKNTQVIEEFINTIIHDANADCRLVGRKMYFSYLNQNEVRAKKLFNIFDNQMKKAINEEFQGEEIENNKLKYSTSGDSKKLLSSPQKGQPSESAKIFSNSAGNKFNNNNKINSLTSEYSQDNFLKLEKTSLPENPDNKNKVFSKTETKNLASKLNRVTLEEAKEINKNQNNFSHKKNIKVIEKNEDSPVTQTTEGYHHPFNNSNFDFMSNNQEKLSYINMSKNFQPSKEYSKLKKEFEISDLNKYLTILNFESNIYKKIEVFQSIENNFKNIYSEIESIPNYIIKSLIETLINFLSDSRQMISVTVMKILSKFFFYIDEIFIEENLSQIIKLVIINLSSTDENISNQANDLFEIMLGKIENTFLTHTVMEIFVLDLECNIKIKCVEILHFIISGKKCQLDECLLSEIYDKLTECINKFKNNSNKNLYKILSDKAKSLIDFINKNFPRNINNKTDNQITYHTTNYTTIPATPIQKAKEEDFLSTLVRHNSDTLISYIKSDPFNNVEKFLNSSLSINNYDNLNLYLTHFQNILISSAQVFNGYEDILVEKVVKLFEKFSNDFHEKFKDILFMIGSKIDSNEFFSNLTTYINRKENPFIVQVLIETITNLIKFLDKRSLKIWTPLFIKSLVESLDHPIPNVRKQAVFCIVELYFLLGAEFEVFLKGIDLSNKNLIYLYLKKKKETI